MYGSTEIEVKTQSIHTLHPSMDHIAFAGCCSVFLMLSHAFTLWCWDRASYGHTFGELGRDQNTNGKRKGWERIRTGYEGKTMCWPWQHQWELIGKQAYHSMCEEEKTRMMFQCKLCSMIKVKVLKGYWSDKKWKNTSVNVTPVNETLLKPLIAAIGDSIFSFS